MLAGPLLHFSQCHNSLIYSCTGHQCFYHPILWGGWWYNMWDGCQFLHPLSPASMALDQSRLLHHVVLAPCTNNSPLGGGCSLGSNDGAVDRESFVSVAACLLTILEMVVDLGSVSVDFIKWPLGVTILIEFDMGFLSGEHTFVHSFNGAVSLRVVPTYSWWKIGFPLRTNEISIDFSKDRSCVYLESNRMCGGSGHATSPIDLGT